MHTLPKALTLDLDDTLWPIWPTIDRAELALHAWLAAHAPATVRRFDRAGLRTLRDVVAAENPHWAHDLSAIRSESLRRALLLAGDDPGHAPAAFEVFFAARQQVVLYDDALVALQRLSERFPLMALTNGNADLDRIGLAPFFQGNVTARSLGVAKPDSRIFHHACAELGCSPAEVLHIGDDFALDVAGAMNAGLQAVWLRRENAAAPSAGEGYRVFSNLTALADSLLA
ncbi:MAG: HAD-IA family hydrolase [Cytophagales bacterium]|nr:HAD-IA family hydrolase [Rhizobacter sp.]